MTELFDPLAVAVKVVDALEALGVAYTIGGSIASSIAGEPRSTLDIDVVAALDEAHVAPLVAALHGEFYADADALRRAVRERRSTNFVHQDSQLKVDVFVAGGTALDFQQLGRRRAVDVAGRTLFVHPPEDILLQKLRWFRLGGETSDRQWRDIVGIVRVQGSQLDVPYLRLNGPVLDVADLVERALAAA
jgi:hypothetical protein